MATRRPPPASVELDRCDVAILDILQRDNSTSQRAIGEAVRLSAPAVQRRIKRMEETGVIQTNIAVIDHAKIGGAITIFVEAQLAVGCTDMIDAAKQRFAAAPEVQQCYYVTGEADFILVVVVASMGEFEDLTRRLFFDKHHVRRFRTVIAMDRVKVGLSVPLTIPERPVDTAQP